MSINKITKKCCGCRTCIKVCKHDAINCIYDSFGFEIMNVDLEKCINCGACEKVCPSLNINLKPSLHDNCGAAYSLNTKILMNSSSGGLFGTFAKQIIIEGGVVYGAAFNENLKLCTKRVDSEKELYSLFQSKYLLCDTNNSFEMIQSDLESNKKVLYCSTPCQIAALKLYLNKNYNNLLLIDLICHGVGSQHLFDTSNEYLKRKKNISIIHFSFRYKFEKASSHYHYYTKFLLTKKQLIKEEVNLYLYNPYFNAYCKQLICRDCCYICDYANENRVSDITIGDFHNIDKYLPKVDRLKGVSMYICNTEKGEKFFNTLKNSMTIYKFKWNILAKENRFHPYSNVPVNKSHFFNYIISKGFDKAVNKYLNPLNDWKRIIYYNLPKYFRQIIINTLK